LGLEIRREAGLIWIAGAVISKSRSREIRASGTLHHDRNTCYSTLYQTTCFIFLVRESCELVRRKDIQFNVCSYRGCCKFLWSSCTMLNLLSLVDFSLMSALQKHSNHFPYTPPDSPHRMVKSYSATSLSAHISPIWYATAMV
jgi:hypothetical protein